MAANTKAIVLLSSGLDSSVALAMAIEQGYEFELGLTINYCQRAARIESERAASICKHYGIKHQTISLPWFSELAHAGALLCGQDVPTLEPEQLDDGKLTEQTAKAVWVPNRNGLMLEVAAAFAEDRLAKHIVVGFNAEEAKTFPDNSMEYLEALNHALCYSTSTGVKIICPTAKMTKKEIVKKAIELDFPLPLIWSCYEAGEEMCGRCESCQRLKRALNQNGVETNGYFVHATA